MSPLSIFSRFFHHPSRKEGNDSRREPTFSPSALPQSHLHMESQPPDASQTKALETQASVPSIKSEMTDDKAMDRERSSSSSEIDGLQRFVQIPQRFLLTNLPGTSRKQAKDPLSSNVIDATMIKAEKEDDHLPFNIPEVTNTGLATNTSLPLNIPEMTGNRTPTPENSLSATTRIKAEEIKAEKADLSPLSNALDPMTEDNLPEGTDEQIAVPEEPFSQASELKAEEAEASSFSNAPDPMFEEDSNLPSTRAEIYRYQYHRTQANQFPGRMLAVITVKLVRDKRELEVEFPGAEEAIKNLLTSLYMLIKSEPFSVADEKSLRIRELLTILMGDCHTARGPYAYPPTIQMKASALLDLVNERLPPIEDVREAAVDASPSGAPRAHKRRKTDPDQQLPFVVPDATMRAVMRGIVDSSTGRRSYSIPDKSILRNCNVVGHNGIALGTWWPYRICVLRDGAHGATMAGIAGSVYDGAYSIVVSGLYADLDRDNGNVLYYSGSKSHDNEDALNPIITTSTRALQTSKRESRSVRVIRAAGGNTKYAPSVGFRYDGLYKIIEEERPKNYKGGRYVRFTLVRNIGQAEIDLSRPNRQERAIFNQLKEF